MKKINLTIIISVIFCNLVFFNIAAHCDVLFKEPSPNYEPGKPAPFKDGPHVYIFGLIKKNDIDDLKICIEKYKKHPSKFINQLIVSLNSKGGDVIAAMEMGKILRDNKAMIWVFPGSECSSACVLILAGGVNRNICYDTKIGIHRPIYNEEYFSNLNYSEATKLYTKMIVELHDYLSNMGIKESLFERMMSIRSNELEYISDNYAEGVGLHGEDIIYEEWVRAKTVQRWGKKLIIWHDRLFECLQNNGPSASTSCFVKVFKECNHDKNFSFKECMTAHDLILYPKKSRAEIQERIDTPISVEELQEIIEELRKSIERDKSS